MIREKTEEFNQYKKLNIVSIFNTKLAMIFE